MGYTICIFHLLSKMLASARSLPESFTLKRVFDLFLSPVRHNQGSENYGWEAGGEK